MNLEIITATSNRKVQFFKNILHYERFLILIIGVSRISCSKKKKRGKIDSYENSVCQLKRIWIFDMS